MVGLDAASAGYLVESSCADVYHAVLFECYAVLIILLRIGRLCDLCISVRQSCTAARKGCVLHDCRASV